MVMVASLSSEWRLGTGVVRVGEHSASVAYVPTSWWAGLFSGCPSDLRQCPTEGGSRSLPVGPRFVKAGAGETGSGPDVPGPAGLWAFCLAYFGAACPALLRPKNVSLPLPFFKSI